MKRHWLIALAASLIIPRLAVAQASAADWGPTVRITPFVGISPTFKQTGEATVNTGTGVALHDYELRFASGVGLGVAAELRLWSWLGLLASGSWSTRGEGELIDETDGRTHEIDGTDLFMGKAALSIRLLEGEPGLQLRRANASIYAGPALIHDRPKAELFTPAAAAQAETHMAINFGADAEMPLANERLAVVIGLEDYMIFWDEEKARGRVEGTLQNSYPGASVAIQPDRSHLFQIRLGLTLRF